MVKLHRESINMSFSRETHLDSMRGVAALIVVVVHYLSAFYPYTVYGPSIEFEQHAAWEGLFFFPPFGLLVAGRLAICLFFILSGYVLSYRYLGEARQIRKILAHIIKRPVRLGGLVWVTVILGALMWNYGLFLHGPSLNVTAPSPWLNGFWIWDFNFHTFFVFFTKASFRTAFVYNPPLWTIRFELYGSLMVYAFLFLIGEYRFRFLVSILLIVLFKNSLYQGFWIGVLIADLNKHYPFQYFKRFKSLYFYLLFILFIFFSSYPDSVTQEFLGSTIYSFLPDDKNFGGGYPMIAAVSVFILVLSSLRVKKYLSWSLLRFLGGISYGLYAVHFLVLASLSARLFVALNNYMGYGTSFLIVFISAIPVIILLGYLLTIYVDYPAIRLAAYLGKKGTSLDTLLPLKKIFFRTKSLS